MPQISFIHLSDIHFHKFSSDRYDVDQDLRNEIKIDIQLEYPKNIENATGILLCGDIAFSGQSKEYQFAKQFLKEILCVSGLNETDVYCVPGNHDVDQSVPKNEPAVYSVQKMLAEQSDHNKFDEIIANIFHSNISKKVIYAPIECYNSEFAAQYCCDLTNDKPYWEKSLMLSTTYELLLHGINSTIISNADDHKRSDIERKMRISHCQLPKRKVNTIHMTLCHHPPECWFDPNDELSHILDERVSIQLYGHKHLQTICSNRKTIIIGSGAAHPSRRESNWTPRYNWITINIINSDTPCLEVKIFPRVWNGTRFVCDEENCSIIEGHKKNYYVNQLDINDSNTFIENINIPLQVTVSEAAWKRSFVYSFINLSSIYRQSILEKLGLFSSQTDEGKKHSEIIKDIISRAEINNCVTQLIEEVNKYKEVQQL